MCAATVFSVALSSVFMGLSFFSGIRASFQDRLHPIADDPRTNSRAEFNNEFSEKSKLVSPSFGRLFRELKNSLARLIFLLDGQHLLTVKAFVLSYKNDIVIQED
jgi:hypothetical protein